MEHTFYWETMLKEDTFQFFGLFVKKRPFKNIFNFFFLHFFS